jgi:hypothetical protein
MVETDGEKNIKEFSGYVFIENKQQGWKSQCIFSFHDDG